MIVGDLVTPGAIGTATGASRLRGSFEYPVSSQKGGNGEVNEVRHMGREIAFRIRFIRN
jgi:hypothetical protein